MYQQIVVGTDGSEAADIAVDAAIAQGAATDGTVHVVSVYKSAHGATLAMASEAAIVESAVAADKASQAAAEQICARAVARAEAAGVRAEGHAVNGIPADALIGVAEEVGADLVVVGNRGMSGARRFVLGSVPNKVSHHCPTNLLIVDTASEHA